MNLVKKSIYLAFLSYALLFLTTKFHPQWILLIMPFIVLSYSFEKSKGYQIAIIESVGFLAFISLTVNIWKNNIDQKMITQGPLSQLLPTPHFLIADFFNFHPIKPLLMGIFYLYLIHPLYLRYINIRREENIQYMYLRFMVVFVFICFCLFSLIPTKKNQGQDIESQEIYKKSLKCLYSDCK